MARNQPCQRIAFLIAAYGHYLSAGQTEKGHPYTVAEPQLDAGALRIARDEDVLSFLTLPMFDGMAIRDNPGFIRLYTQFRAGIRSEGILETLKKIES
jgi:mannitol 2-dehydrogenase